MLHNLEKFTRKYLAFTAEELFSLAKLFHPLLIKENNSIIESGQLVSNIYFLDNGVLKSYLKKNDEQLNIKFYFGPVFFSDINALINKTASIGNFVTVKESNVFIAKFEDIVKLNAKSENHKRFFEKILKNDYMFHYNSSI